MKTIKVTLYPGEAFENYPVYHAYVTLTKAKIWIGTISTLSLNSINLDEDGKFYEEVLDFSDYEINLSVRKLYQNKFGYKYNPDFIIEYFKG